MSSFPSHRIFRLPTSGILKVLAENGAHEVKAESHTPSPHSAAKKQSYLLSYEELKSLKGISYTRQHLLRLEEAGKFPKRIKMGARVNWFEHEIDEYVLGHAEARSLQRA